MQKHRLKQQIWVLVIGLLTIPPTAFAINPYYVSKGQTIGAIFRENFFRVNFFFSIVPWILLILILIALILGYFIHRKYIAWLFFAVYPVIFLYPILTNKDTRLSNILLSNIHSFYVTVFITIVAFTASTLFNKIRKKKHKLSDRDFIPMAIIIAIVLILTFSNVPSGLLVCNVPVINQSFNCTHY